MENSDKKKILLLGHNMWQERALALKLRLGGYDPHIAKNSHEVINLVKLFEGAVHTIVLPGNGNQRVLNERLDFFSEHEVTSSIVLVGMSSQDIEKSNHISRRKMNLSACWPDQILDCLSQ